MGSGHRHPGFCFPLLLLAGLHGGDLVALKGEYQLGDDALIFSYTTSADGGDGGFIGLGY